MILMMRMGGIASYHKIMCILLPKPRALRLKSTGVCICVHIYYVYMCVGSIQDTLVVYNKKKRGRGAIDGFSSRISSVSAGFSRNNIQVFLSHNPALTIPKLAQVQKVKHVLLAPPQLVPPFFSASFLSEYGCKGFLEEKGVSCTSLCILSSPLPIARLIGQASSFPLLRRRRRKRKEGRRKRAGNGVATHGV